jgi:IS30 family transposase
LHDAVNPGLQQTWSPKQISKRLRQDFPDDDTLRMSHETIYQCLYLQARGELRTQLTLALRQGRTRRVNRSRTTVARGEIPDMVNISERPVEAEDRAVPGLTGIDVYFCDSHSPWQRGSNENTNGLLRQDFPKGTDLSDYAQAELDAVADELNNSPRQTLGWLKPTEVFNKFLVEAGGALTT